MKIEVGLLLVEKLELTADRINRPIDTEIPCTQEE